MIDYIKYKDILLKGIGSLGCLLAIMVVNGDEGNMTLEGMMEAVEVAEVVAMAQLTEVAEVVEIAEAVEEPDVREILRVFVEETKEATNGKGICSVAVTNTGKKDTSVHVFSSLVSLASKLLDCDLFYLYYIHRKECAIEVKANTTVIVELPLLFMDSLEGYDIEQYDNLDNLLPLSENSEIIVEVRNELDAKEFGAWKSSRYEVDWQDSLRGFNKVFKAKYLAGTRLIEFPDQMQILIDYDDPVPLENYNSDQKRRYLKWLRS